MENKLQQAKDTIAQKRNFKDWNDLNKGKIRVYNEEYIDQISIEYHRLMSDWVSVETDLPNIEKEVLVFHKTQGCIIMRLEYTKSERLIWYDTEGQHCDFELITHWKKLPQSPK